MFSRFVFSDVSEIRMPRATVARARKRLLGVCCCRLYSIVPWIIPLNDYNRYTLDHTTHTHFCTGNTLQQSESTIEYTIPTPRRRFQSLSSRDGSSVRTTVGRPPLAPPCSSALLSRIRPHRKSHRAHLAARRVNRKVYRIRKRARIDLQAVVLHIAEPSLSLNPSVH